VERLWSPWRLAYVTGAAGGSSDCIFCDAVDPALRPEGLEGSPLDSARATPEALEGSRDALLVARGRVSFVILNRYPYNNGHLLIAPNRHVATLAELSEEELAETMWFTRGAEIALTEAYQPQGINVGINLGRPAGAGIVDHVHIHVVPRWIGDTNFMAVVGNVRVLPEELGDTANRLRPIFERLQRDAGFGVRR
jgi:ATP adenylyltransferase